MHKLTARGANLPTDIDVGVSLHSQVGHVPTATVELSCEGRECPDPTDLLEQPLALYATTGIGANAGLGSCVFDGRIRDVSVRYWAPDRALVELSCAEGPLTGLRAPARDAAWFSVPRGTALRTVVERLFERLGFDARCESSVEDSTVDQLVCAGQDPFDFTMMVLQLHGVFLAYRPAAGGGARYALVRTAEGANALGGGIDLEVSSAGGRAEATGVIVRRSTTLPEAGVVWWDALAETGGVAGPARSIWPGHPVASEAVATALQKQREAARMSGQHVVAVTCQNPNIGVGDRVSLASGADRSLLPWLGNALSNLYVVGVSMHQALGSAQRVECELRLVPGEAAPAVASTRELDSGWSMVPGTVTEVPAGQGQTKVELDVRDPSGDPVEVVCEWMSPCFSGEAGALHMPPVVNDRVRLLLDPTPYGRVVYLGAVPGDDRLELVRRAMAGEYEMVRPSDANGRAGAGVQLLADHNARAIAASPQNLMVWASPNAGLAANGGDAAGQWRVVSNGSAQIAEVMQSELVLRDVQGSDSRVEARSEGEALFEGKASLELVVGETLNISSREADLNADDNFATKAGKSMALTCTDATIECEGSGVLRGKDLELAGSNTKIAGDSATEISGGQVKIN